MRQAPAEEPGGTTTCDDATPALARCLHAEAETPAAPDLARIITAWPDLPAHIKAAILALVGTAR